MCFGRRAAYGPDRARILRCWQASGAAFVYAADGQASEVAVLETVSNFAAVLACGVFVETTRLSGHNRWHKILLVLSGIFGRRRILAKLPGLALFYSFANLFSLEELSCNGDLGLAQCRFRSRFANHWGACFVLKGGIGAFLRQVVFFQLLRPQEVRAGIDEIARVSDYPETRLTILLVR